MISKRLLQIANMIPKDMIVADIGTDHAFLPVYLMENGLAKKVYACDNKEGPLSGAIAHIEEANLTGSVIPILSDGLTDVPKDTEVIAISGMGSELILEILDAHLSKFEHIQRIIVQGNTSVQKLRQYISGHNYRIVDECVVEEYKYYQIISFDLTPAERPLEAEEVWLGPVNIRKRSETFEKYLHERYNYLYKLNLEHPLKDQREFFALKKVLTGYGERKMLTIYGSAMCPDCVACKRNFDFYGIEYHFIDINLKLHDLADFLSLRDKLPVFDHCKEIGDIGLPALVKEDGEVFLNWEGYLKEKGYEVLPEEGEIKAACSLDRKGC